MKQRSILITTVLLLVVLVLAACGGADEGPAESGTTGETVEEPAEEPVEEPTEEPATEPEPMTVEYVVDNEFAYKPEAVIEATVGQSVEFAMNNTSEVFQHNIVWDEDTDTVFLMTEPGEEAAATRTFDSAGTYGYHCSIPGHKEGGMVGEVIVTE